MKLLFQSHFKLLRLYSYMPYAQILPSHEVMSKCSELQRKRNISGSYGGDANIKSHDLLNISIAKVPIKNFQYV